ncbi:hypothetical protein Pan258_22020 [Symmachiella dynata]|nr:hypothetical protein Pan258_22020 [Symmachiella dynata]
MAKCSRRKILVRYQFSRFVTKDSFGAPESREQFANSLLRSGKTTHRHRRPSENQPGPPATTSSPALLTTSLWTLL